MDGLEIVTLAPEADYIPAQAEDCTLVLVEDCILVLEVVFMLDHAKNLTIVIGHPEKFF